MAVAASASTTQPSTPSSTQLSPSPPGADAEDGRDDVGHLEAQATSLSEFDTPTAETPDDSDASAPPDSLEPEAGDEPTPPTLRVHWRVAATACAVLALALILIALLPGETRHDVAAQSARATATPAPTFTPSPTPTVTPLPGPSLMAGFVRFKDPGSVYTVQYPETWSESAEPNLGVRFDFADPNDQNLTYEVDIYHPDPDTSAIPSQGDPNAIAASWVDLELGALQQQVGSETFTRIPGPVPAATISGQTWQSGIAEIGRGDTRIRVQVYATVYNGKPYVINVLAPDNVFLQGEQEYVEPMLSSFQFLHPAA